MRAQLRHGAHGGGEILLGDGGGGLLLGGVDRLGERPFLVLAIERRVGLADIFARVLLLLDAEDVGGALVAGEQILAVLGVEEFAQRLDPADDEHEIVLAFEREHGIDQIVPRALLAQLDFQAVGEEGEKVSSSAVNSLAASKLNVSFALLLLLLDCKSVLRRETCFGSLPIRALTCRSFRRDATISKSARVESRN